MIDYPKLINKIDISPRFNTIASHLNKEGFVLKGKELNDKEMFVIKSDNSSEIMSKEELEKRQKRQIDYISEHAEEGIKTGTTCNCILMGLSALMIANAILIKVPLFGACFAYFGGISFVEQYKINKLKKNIKIDKWFSDNEEKVQEKLKRGTKLYQKLSDASKVILTRDGKITLNNIDEFPKNDLRLVRRNISRQMKKEEKAKQKTLSR